MRLLALLLLTLSPLARAADLVDREERVEGDPRDTPVHTVVLHATGGPSCNPDIAFRSGTLNGIVSYFKSRTDGVTIHYVLGRDGTLVSMVPEERKAYHAYGHNEGTVGIELINKGNGRDPYAEPQLDKLVALLAQLLAHHGLSTDAITTHAAIDSRYIECVDGEATVNREGRGFPRSQDPGSNFPLRSVIARVDAALTPGAVVPLFIPLPFLQLPM